MDIRFFYGQYEYTDDEQLKAMAAALAVDPEEPAGFVSSTFKLLRSSLAINDFKLPPIQMQRMCDVLAAVARLRGEDYLK